MNERTARLRTLVSTPTWSDLNALLSESVNEILQNALLVEKEGDAINLLKQARAAQLLASTFIQRVTNAAQIQENS